MKQLLAFSLLGWLLVGCSSPRVTTDFAEGTSFSGFRTFQYKDSTNSLAVSSPLSHQRIVNAIRAGMISSGFIEVEVNPDLFVTYYGSTDQQTHFHTTYTGMNTWGGSSRSRNRVGFDTTSSTTRPTTVTQGTLVIDVWDASRNALLWRSVATSALSSNPQRNAQTIKEAVERAFRDFPPQ
ncbi:MAG TPA: DUF4136 domain-containing protein [Verrucomicrobiota bacterium]|nr:hypothetical protein [Verrucomicrobiales bacterium]HRI12531.1 DUF4136 domain-containing protein [Verrucomicrobiota bacterium]